MESLGNGSLGLFAGVLAPLRGAVFFSRYPKLWRGVLLAVFVQITVTFLLLAAWMWLSWHWLAPGPESHGVWAVARVAGAGLVALCGILIAAAGGTLLGLALNPMAYTRLALETEGVLGADTARFQPLSTWQQTWEMVRTAVEFLVVNGILLALGFVPGLAPFTAAASFLFNAWFLGRTCLEYAQVSRGITLAARRTRARRYWGAALGVGALVLLWSPIPLVGSILTAAAVAGGVELVQRMEQK